MARPLKGNEPRKLVCIRLEPKEKERLIKKYGGVQAAIDFLLKRTK